MLTILKPHFTIIYHARSSKLVNKLLVNLSLLNIPMPTKNKPHISTLWRQNQTDQNPKFKSTPKIAWFEKTKFLSYHTKIKLHEKNL